MNIEKWTTYLLGFILIASGFIVGLIAGTLLQLREDLELINRYENVSLGFNDLINENLK